MNKKTTNQAESILNGLSFLRIWQIIGDEKRGIRPLIPVSRSTFLNRVRSGEYPQPVKLGERTRAWRTSDIINLINNLNSAQ